MLAYLQQYVLYILGAVIVLLLILCGVQTVRLSMAKAEKATATAISEKKDAQLQSQVAVVRQLAQSGEELTAYITEVHAQAAVDKQRLRNELDNIKKQKAPLDCQGASEWAKEKAAALSGRW